MCIVITIASMSELASRDVPPYDMNGSGMPMTGSRPVTMPRLTNRWIRNTPAVPAARIDPNGLRICAPSLTSRPSRMP